jgi:hypothetical protein
MFTSKYDGLVVSFPLDDLPTNQEYLDAFEIAEDDRRKLNADEVGAV